MITKLERPHRLGVVSRLYPQLTATFLTEELRNIYYADSKPNKFQSTDSTYFEWEVNVSFDLLLQQFFKVLEYATKSAA